MLLFRPNDPQTHDNMDAQQLLEQMANRLNQLEATNATLIQIITTQNLNNQNSGLDEESKYYKRLAAHKPKTYDGDANPVKFHDWVHYMEKLLEVVGCPEHLKVKLASFYLEGPAELWWRALKQTVQTPSSSSSNPNPPLEWTWEQFLEKLKDRFYPVPLQKQKESEFLSLRQHSLTITEYTNKFLELSRFAQEFVSTEQGKVNRYYDGLNFKYQKLMGKCETFLEMYEQALEKERIYVREGEVTKRKQAGNQKGDGSKKPRTDQPQNQFRPQNNNNRPNLNQKQFCPRCRKWHTKGVNCEGKPVCHNCQKPGHFARDCWSNRGTSRGNQGNRFPGPQQQQQQRPRLSGPSPTQPKLEYYGGKTQQPIAQGAGKGKVFALTSGGEGDASTATPGGKALSGFVLVLGHPTRVLFDSGADRSFISTCFVSRVDRLISLTPCHYRVLLPNGSTIICDRELCSVPLEIQGRKFVANLILFDLGEFDMILGMDWLTKNRATLECLDRVITLRDESNSNIVCNLSV